MAFNINDTANNLVNHLNNSINSMDLGNIAATPSPPVTNGKKKRSYDFQNRKIRRRIWQEEEVHKLICVWATRLDDLRQSKKNRHIYEEISDELNSMGLDTIREEVHIKIQNLSQLYRNEKRRIESTGEAPTWQYYHEVDELLGSHNDSSLDLSNLDESHVANNTSSIKDEVVSIGDSGSDNDTDENRHSSNENHNNKNGYDHHVMKKLKTEYASDTMSHYTVAATVANRRSPAVSSTPYNNMSSSSSSSSNKMISITKPQATSSNSCERKSLPVNSSLDALLQAIESASAINDANLTPNNVQLEILREVRKANAMAELERREAKVLHQEMKDLEEQRFKLTQMFIERSLALQKQMLDSLRLLNNRSGKASCNGGSGNTTVSSNDNSFKFSSRQQSNRPQFILTKKKKSNSHAQSSKHETVSAS
ncbi:bromodomain-containing protein DDB_G0270170 [Contarinia nasturtii]|uniref:bromodomain-containing protein DDB_G0270170 n=1 Tax=Contarinia nasturtii TaxID=265458 RepID=UPI0012D4139C|nr:bromodomain-containing protein DDB_G0270170 [Contarinia nasturtii]